MFLGQGLITLRSGPVRKWLYGGDGMEAHIVTPEAGITLQPIPGLLLPPTMPQKQGANTPRSGLGTK